MYPYKWFCGPGPTANVIANEPHTPPQIFRAFKISALPQAINFFQFNMLKLFNAVNAGAELALATPLLTVTSVSFFLTRRELHQTGDVSDACSNFTSAPGVSKTSAQMVLCRRVVVLSSLKLEVIFKV